MKLREIYENKNKQNVSSGRCPVISFEVFPPKNDNVQEKIQKLFSELQILKKYNPQLISVTYGAGGTTTENSEYITKRLMIELNLTPMPHFTCVLKDRKFVDEYLETIKSYGVENILALRGDIPQNMPDTGSEFQYANELVEFIKSKTDLSIGVAGYPEGHIKSKNLQDDIEKLKLKVDAGADVIYTQLFFDNNAFFDYVGRVEKAGIKIPVIPGILPISSFSQTEKMTKMCNTKIPNELKEKLEKYKDFPEEIKKIGIDFASEQCKELIEQGVVGLHFYCLNKSQPVDSVLDNIL